MFHRTYFLLCFTSAGMAPHK